MKTCKKCKSKNISITKDGAFGIRAHCLNCGYTTACPEPVEGPPVEAPQEKEK